MLNHSRAEIDSAFAIGPSQVAMMIFETWLLSIVLLIVGGDGGSLPTGPLRLLRLLRCLKPVNQ